MTVDDLREYVLQVAGKPSLDQDEDVRFGDPHAEVRGVLFCWMATAEALDQAHAQGCNVVVCHEDLWFPYSFRGRPETYLTWKANRVRAERAVRYGLTIFRCHGTMDAICILDDIIRLLGFPEPVVSGPGFVRICQIEPVTVRCLAQQVRDTLSLDAVRVCGNLDQVVRRVGFPWGGLGLSLNDSFLNTLIDQGCEVLVAGEMDEYAMRLVGDCGVPMIETSHSVSENPGIQNFAERFRADHPGLPVVFHENPRPWINV